jgi:hypothetical protein
LTSSGTNEQACRRPVPSKRRSPARRRPGSSAQLCPAPQATSRDSAAREPGHHPVRVDGSAPPPGMEAQDDAMAAAGSVRTASAASTSTATGWRVTATARRLIPTAGGSLTPGTGRSLPRLISPRSPLPAGHFLPCRERLTAQMTAVTVAPLSRRCRSLACRNCRHSGPSAAGLAQFARAVLVPASLRCRPGAALAARGSTPDSPVDQPWRFRRHAGLSWIIRFVSCCW